MRDKEEDLGALVVVFDIVKMEVVMMKLRAQQGFGMEAGGDVKCLDVCV